MLLFIFVAFLGGVLSVLSPCSGALLPTYFAITFKSKNKLLLNTLFFSLGVLLVSVPIGVGAKFLFYILSVWGKVLFQTLGVIFILVAIFTLFDIKVFNFLKLPKYSSKGDYLSSLIFGVISAVSLGACSGPILGAIATLAATTKGYFYSIILMLFYTMGILLPFILISFGVDKNQFLQKIFVKGRQIKITKTYSVHSSALISSTIFIFVGLLFLFYGGSLLSFEQFIKLDTSFMLQWQDRLLNILN